MGDIRVRVYSRPKPVAEDFVRSGIYYRDYYVPEEAYNAICDQRALALIDELEKAATQDLYGIVKDVFLDYLSYQRSELKHTIETRRK